MSVADRSILACWGVKGGKAGLPFRVTIDPGGPNERVLSGLCDDEPIAAGELVRIETTGGGGWGDPLGRDPELVALDVLQGKVSVEAAREQYGVVVGDPEATRQLRERPRPEPPFFDRGPGYEHLAR
jgi:N-methylhydantoinase B